MLAFNHLGTLGRLGNQMFQYASLRGIAANRGYDFGIPPSNFEDEWKNHQLFEVFELPHLPKENVKYLDMGHAPVVQETKFDFNELIFNQCPNDVSLFGFFQSEKYFSNIKESIKEDFTFKEHIRNPCIEVASEWNNPVSLHVRRTDYLINSANHYNLGLDYYEKALRLVDKTSDVIVFSDDPSWCMEQDLFSDDRFIVSESGDNTIDLCLMTLCKSHIIANSSFSWWGAWLSGSSDVIAPSKWFGPNNQNKSTKDLLPESWIILDSK
jgi:hypothetical protein